MSLKKIDIVESVYEKLGMSKKECFRIVASLFDIIKSEFEKGGQVNISGFGKWSVRFKKKRKGRNPQTGDALTIDARTVVMFKPSSVLRAKING